MLKYLNDYLILKTPCSELKKICKHLILFNLVLWAPYVNAQSENPFALGGSNVLPNQSFSFSSNPSADLDYKSDLGILFRKQVSAREILNNGLAGSFKLKNYNLGFDVWQQGTTNLNKQSFRLLCGLKAANNFQLGIEAGVSKINQVQDFASRYSLNGACYANLVLSKYIRSYMQLGFRQNSLKKELTNGYGGFGLVYSTKSNVSFGGYADLQTTKNVTLGFQFNYIPIKSTKVQLNVTNSSIPISFQFLLEKKQWIPSVTYEYHNQLGSRLSFGLEWKIQ